MPCKNRYCFDDVCQGGCLPTQVTSDPKEERLMPWYRYDDTKKEDFEVTEQDGIKKRIQTR